MARTKQTDPQQCVSPTLLQIQDKVKKGKIRASTYDGRKPYRFRPGTVALREITRYQKGTSTILAKKPFSLLVRHIIKNSSWYEGMRISPKAMEALQIASEDMLIQLFADSQRAAIHAKRICIYAEDMKLVRSYKGRRWW